MAKKATKKTVKSAVKAYAKKATKRRAWSKDDVRQMKTLAKAKTPAAKIARSLKRTEAAIRFRASQLGVSLSTR